jgi:gamma-glutamyltranspeptidase / glutathione hydrolase
MIKTHAPFAERWVRGRGCWWPLAVMVVCCQLLPATWLRGETVHSRGGMVATVHPLATQAAVRTLEEGGNAIDAAVAAGLTLGVVDTANSGIGGGCLMLIRSADGQCFALDGRETAPAQATRDMFVVDGQAARALSLTGPLASGVPGALAAYAAAVERFGKRDLRQLIQPAADLAAEGFALDPSFADRLDQEAEKLGQFAGSRQILFTPEGRPYQAGDWLTQADLARTYRAIAAEGPGWFYQGHFAQQVADWMRQHGGLLTRADFAAYRVRWREPIVTSYRQYELVGFPPPSSGGIHVAQVLNMMETWDLRAVHASDPVAFIHLVSEGLKRAFADRAFWLGDSDFVRVPRGLLEKSYAAERARTIDPTRATEVPRHGLPPGWEDVHFGKHTTHVATADAAGNWVALTQTLNTSFGSGIIVPGTGVMLNNQMDDFSIHPGTPNVFGLVGGEANAIMPAKRPLSSMSPTIVLEEGRPIVTAGAAGGPTIISQVVLVLTRYLDLGLPLDEAVAGPRFHHQWLPNQLVVERSMAADVITQLQAWGHDVTVLETMGVTQAIAQPDPDGPLYGVHDPRVPGLAAGPTEPLIQRP